jgi:two-component system, sensor histidine kinase and response regulator
MLSPSPLDIASDAPSFPLLEPSALEKPTLLIVDDEEGPRQSLRIVFKNEYNVFVASNGTEALAIARERHIDVAVLDILMSGMSGVEVLKHLKELDPSIEVVMLTAYETLETARQALRHGASDYLNKPFDIPTMRAAVSRAVEKHRASLGFKENAGQLQELRRLLEEQQLKEEIERTRGEIYASVLHDINSPLTVIYGFIDLINRAMRDATRVEGPELESMKDDLRSLNGQVGRCFEISRRYLRFLNREAAESSSSSVLQILKDLRELLIRHPAASGHTLLVHEPQAEIVARVNGTDFLQVLLNLTINALQASTSPHTVEVRAFLLEVPIDATRFLDGPTERFINRSGFVSTPPLVGLVVSDTGPGITPENVQRVFSEQFTTKSPDQGTGLGLSIVKRLVQAVNGAVHLKSEVGKGTKFTVFLPAA